MRKAFLVGSVLAVALFASSSFAASVWNNPFPKVSVDNSQAQENYSVAAKGKFSDGASFQVANGDVRTVNSNMKIFSYEKSMTLDSLTLQDRATGKQFCDVMEKLHGSTPANIDVKIIPATGSQGASCTVNGMS